MKSLVVVATPMEIAPFIAHNFQKITSNWYTSAQCDVFIAGLGIVPTVFNLSQFLQEKRYQSILNVGIAGTYQPDKIKLLEVVAIEADAFGDFGVEDDAIFMPIADFDFFVDQHLQASWIQADFIPKGLTAAKGLTVQLGAGKAITIEQRKHHWQADVETMESAAVFYVAKQMNIPVGAIRAISNAVEPRNTANWKVKEAIERLNGYLVPYFQ